MHMFGLQAPVDFLDIHHKVVGVRMQAGWQTQSHLQGCRLEQICPGCFAHDMTQQYSLELCLLYGDLASVVQHKLSLHASGPLSIGNQLSSCSPASDLIAKLVMLPDHHLTLLPYKPASKIVVRGPPCLRHVSCAAVEVSVSVAGFVRSLMGGPDCAAYVACRPSQSSTYDSCTVTSQQ